MKRFEIRAEREGDAAAIRRVTEAAFRGRPYADGDEADVIERLRAAAALTLSLLATAGAETIGHAAFSPATLRGAAAPWYALGPVSVLPEYQRRGVGTALIESGLERLRERGAGGCILLGDPGYYARFGFAPAPANAPPGLPAGYFQLKAFTAAVPGGRFAFHPAFHRNGV